MLLQPALFSLLGHLDLSFYSFMQWTASFLLFPSAPFFCDVQEMNHIFKYGFPFSNFFWGFKKFLEMGESAYPWSGLYCFSNSQASFCIIRSIFYKYSEKVPIINCKEKSHSFKFFCFGDLWIQFFSRFLVNNLLWTGNTQTIPNTVSFRFIFPWSPLSGQSCLLFNCKLMLLCGIIFSLFVNLSRLWRLL